MLTLSLIQLLACGEWLLQESSASQLDQMGPIRSKLGLDYSRWRGDEGDRSIPSSENDIESTLGTGSAASAHRSQGDYICGRAVANRKFKELLLRDQSYSAMSRAKYRPIEIRMPRIIGGDETAPGEFPWTVSVKLNGQPICGGSLIDRSWILTAAHCVVGYNPRNLTVRLGAYRIKDTSETQTVELPVSMFIVHKQYSMPRPFSNDIALLRMAEQVDYSDYIIPVCLPTEDQVSPTMNEFAVGGNSHMKNYGQNNNNNNDINNDVDDDSAGVVISTQMSDKEISKCFKKLEQNYLNSIGLGTASNQSLVVAESIAATTNSGQQVVPQQYQQQLQQATALLAAGPTLALPPPATAGNKRHLLAFDSLLEPIFVANNQHKDSSQAPYGTATGLDRILAGPTRYRQHAEQHFESLATTSQELDQSHRQQYNDRPANSYIYYGLPWAKGGQEQLVESRNSNQMIKLTSLPISKELLHEIQSVGSMPSLSFDTLQQGDFLAMASDLTGSPSGNADRERIITNGGGSRQIVRTLTEDASENDDSTKYSGLSGTVVGWGWVREHDSEEQASNNNKGYPSVTLQKVKLPILRNNDCEAWFQSQSKKITLLPSQFCAGFNSGGKDACRVSHLRSLWSWVLIGWVLANTTRFMLT